MKKSSDCNDYSLNSSPKNHSQELPSFLLSNAILKFTTFPAHPRLYRRFWDKTTLKDKT